MEITTLYIREKFIKYNELYFNNILPIPSFKIIRSKRTLGRYEYRRIKSSLQHTICITNHYKFDEKKYDTIIIHEMIHLYLKVTNAIDSSPHGYLFKKECNRINKDGWNIVSHDSVIGYEIKNTSIYNLCIMKCINQNTKIEDYFIFRMCDNLKHDFIKGRRTLYDKNAKFFTSTNSIFDNFTNCRERIRGKYVNGDIRYNKYIEMYNK